MRETTTHLIALFLHALTIMPGGFILFPCGLWTISALRYGSEEGEETLMKEKLKHPH